MAVKLKDTKGNYQIVPNSSEVSGRISELITSALKEIGLDTYEGNLPEAIQNLSDSLGEKLEKDFAGGTIVKSISLTQDPLTGNVTIRGKLIDPATGAEEDYLYEFTVGKGGGDTTEIAKRIQDIEAKIPPAASSTNPLVDTQTLNNSVSQMAAERVTYNAEGDPFPTRAALLSATQFYAKGKLYTPNDHDYTLVEADEGAPAPFTGGQTRFEFDGTRWVYSYGINDKPLDSNQLAAVNSGITADKVKEFEGKYSKPEAGIPYEDLADNVQETLQKANTALQPGQETDPTVPAWAKQENPPTYTKEDVGLGNVDNTSDQDKPVSTAQQEALDTKVDKKEGWDLSENNFTDGNKLFVEQQGPQGLENLNQKTSSLENQVLLKQNITDESLPTSDKTIVGSINEIFGIIQGISGEITSGVISVNGRTGVITLSKADVGLSNVDNTSDMAKPVSTAQQLALDQKVDKEDGKVLSSNDFTDEDKSKLDGIEDGANNYVLPSDVVQDSEYVHTDNNYTTLEKTKLSGIEEGAQKNVVLSVAGKTGVINLDKADVGLNNVDNTSDEDKPVSTLQQAALNNKVDKVAGKGLSTNDYNAAAKQAVEETLPQGIANNESAISGVSGRVTNIENLLEPEAGGNQLANHDYVDKAVATGQSHRVTYNAAGDQFPTKAALLAAKVFYYQGQEHTLDANDYTFVTADESAPAPYTGGQTRYEYDGTQWNYAYGIGTTPFTEAQQAALDSGVTAAIVAKANSAYQKPSTGIPKADLEQSVQASLGKADTAIQEEVDPTVPEWAKSPTKPTYTKSEVGLGNVDNTSDLDKPLSTAQQAALNNKVDKITGKGLSTNDYTTEEKNKLSGIAVGAQVNVIDEIKVNGVALTPDGKSVNVTVPTTPSDIGAQEELVSGTNIKTINGQSLLGEGDLDVAGADSVVDLTSDQTIGGTKTFEISPVVPEKTSAPGNDGTAIATEAQVKVISDIANSAIKPSDNLNADKLVGTIPETVNFPVLNQDTIGNAGTANKLKTPVNIEISGKATAAAKQFDGTANINLEVTSLSQSPADYPILNQDTTGSAAKLSIPRSLKVNLGSAADIEFDGSADAEDIPVKGRLNFSNLAQGAGESATQRRVLGTSKGTTSGDLALQALDKADVGLSNVDNIQQATKTEFNELKARVDNLENLGNFVGSFATAADLPDTSSSVPGLTITVNDFATVRQDENHSGFVSRYVVSEIGEDGGLTWNYDFSIEKVDISGKIDKVTGATGYIPKFTSNGNLESSGYTPDQFATDAELAEEVTKIENGTTVAGKAEIATQLESSRTFRTNLGSTEAVGFNGTENVSPGVTGVLPAANGGTGNTSGKAAGLTKGAVGSATQPVYFDSTGNPVQISEALGTLAFKNYPTVATGGGVQFMTIDPSGNIGALQNAVSLANENKDGTISSDQYKFLDSKMNAKVFYSNTNIGVGKQFSWSSDGSGGYVKEFTKEDYNAIGGYTPGKIAALNIYLPTVRTFIVLNSDTVVETFDSSEIDVKTGNVRVYSNSQVDCLVLIY